MTFLIMRVTTRHDPVTIAFRKGHTGSHEMWLNGTHKSRFFYLASEQSRRMSLRGTLHPLYCNSRERYPSC